MIQHLKSAWDQIKTAYSEDRLNSERCLQAALYSSLTRSLDATHTIFVEPNWNAEGMIPDLVVCAGESIRAIVEIKCAPHYWLPAAGLSNDLEKLQRYAGFFGQAIRLDVYGPESRFDLESRKWHQATPRFFLRDDTLFVFAVIARRDDRATDLQGLAKVSQGIRNLRGFVLLAGATAPDAPPGDEARYQFFDPQEFERVDD